MSGYDTAAVNNVNDQGGYHSHQPSAADDGGGDMGISIKVKAKGDTIGGWPDEDAEFNPLVTAFLEKNKGPFDIQAFQKFIREQRKK